MVLQVAKWSVFRYWFRCFKFRLTCLTLAFVLSLISVQLFSLFDTDADGFLTPEDLHRALEDHDVRLKLMCDCSIDGQLNHFSILCWLVPCLLLRRPQDGFIGVALIDFLSVTSANAFYFRTVEFVGSQTLRAPSCFISNFVINVFSSVAPVSSQIYPDGRDMAYLMSR